MVANRCVMIFNVSYQYKTVDNNNDQARTKWFRTIPATRTRARTQNRVNDGQLIGRLMKYNIIDGEQ